MHQERVSSWVRDAQTPRRAVSRQQDARSLLCRCMAKDGCCRAQRESSTGAQPVNADTAQKSSERNVNGSQR